jgi:KDO2-lipid IV(A) lauroyltransferase
MLANLLLLRNFSISLSKFCQMRFNSFLFRVLPFSFSRRYLAALGRLYYLLNRQEKRFIRKTIAYVFRRRLSSPRLRKVISGTFRGLFDHYHEKLFVAYSHFGRLLPFLKTRISFAGEESLQAALSRGNGVLLVTGHFGAVEFLPGVLALKGYPVSMICRFQTDQLRDSLLDRAHRVSLDIINADDGNVFLAAVRALKRGRILITECDEFDEWRHGPQSLWFLDNKLPADRSLEILKKRSGAPVVTALLQRNGRATYTLNLTPIPDGGAPVTEQCLNVLEEAILAHPEQWYQWKKFGKMIQSRLEVSDAHQESGYLAPEVGLSVPDQA